MPTTLRLLVKSVRFELAAVVLGSALLAGAALFIAGRLNAIGMPLECHYLQPMFTASVAPLDPQLDQRCDVQRTAFYTIDNDQAAPVMALMGGAPLVAGLILGVPLVARELESGTAAFAWTLGRSRRRWFLSRALPLGGVLGLALLGPALAGQVLEGARTPAIDPGASFFDFGLRGGILVARGLLAFAVALLAGALVGRQLPALIVAGAVTALLVTGGDIAIDRLQHDTATWRPEATIPGGSLYFAQGSRREGSTEVLPMDAALGQVVGKSAGQLDPAFEVVLLSLSGRLYPSFVTGAAAAAGVGSALLVLATVAVIDRRRPS